MSQAVTMPKRSDFPPTSRTSAIRGVGWVPSAAITEIPTSRLPGVLSPRSRAPQ
jgi:hypothetical protein